MRLRSLMLGCAAVCAMAPSVTHASDLFCGAGIITSFGIQATGPIVSNRPQNFYFKLDNSIAPPQSGVTLSTIAGTPGFIEVYYYSDAYYSYLIEAVQKAYLAGLPVRVTSTGGSACWSNDASSFGFQVCSSSSDCSSTAQPVLSH